MTKKAKKKAKKQPVRAAGVGQLDLPPGMRLMTPKEVMTFTMSLGCHLLTDAAMGFDDGDIVSAAKDLKTLSVTALAARRAILGKKHTMVTDAPNARVLASRVGARLAQVRDARLRARRDRVAPARTTLSPKKKPKPA